MQYFSENTSNSNSNSNSSSPTSSAPISPTVSSSPPQVILSPCAACKILRRRCVEKCVLAPYFPPTDPLKFTIAHKVFGASNIIKLLQELPETHRVDAVNSLVYEAQARIRDPVYGCAGAVCQLQKQLSDLQAELAKAKAEILNMQCQNADLLTLICMEMSEKHQETTTTTTTTTTSQWQLPPPYENTSLFLDEGNLGSVAWEPLWA